MTTNQNKSHVEAPSFSESEQASEAQSSQEIVSHVIENPQLLDRILNEPKVQALVYEQFQGPVPPPSMLRDYESLMPGLANRLVELTEKEQQHRHAQDKRYYEGNLKLSGRGQWMAFVVVLVIIAAAVYFGAKGFTALAAILVGIDLVAICSVFIAGKIFTQSKSDTDKS